MSSAAIKSTAPSTSAAEFDYGNSRDWILAAHSYYQTIPRTNDPTYGLPNYNDPNDAEHYHPEWFASGQLCLTDPDLKTTFVENLKSIIKQTPYGKIVSLGENDGTGGMVSFNHYASGAVGDFLYKRVAGIEPLEGGYKRFRVQPVIGGGITWAKASTATPYGIVSSDWKIEDSKFKISISVPVSTICDLVLPDGSERVVESGNYQFECAV